MAYVLDKDTQITIRAGMQSVQKRWDTIAFEYIGSKSPDLADVHRALICDGVAAWNGFSLFHPSHKGA